ncbi:aminoacyl-histidine dipeptidase [Paraferrimonas sedimenticola]|uniref:Cytosol non-specific dipeptidase n=1 Tax=Paraferrimonas sedimenticola TaxID=375674 RepID=A0AA37RX52_9GAMM|nr:aminoacyl-histidine dipeptidase [Paraferrimonas sedimenticola]GLP96918.1 aminoacyl-histidine dipeptidase [Paraferrimonas sedimenticola]
MASLQHLSPQPLWHWFEQICSIPHPSKHEQQLIEHIKAWVETQPKVTLKQDATGNLILSKPATPGMEDRKGVVLQAHLDMVPQKNNDKDHDFVTDPIETLIDGEWLTANGTTLGADNGIGMASALAVLQSDDIEHGPLEVLLTVDEEAGMTGAFGLQSDSLNGEILINTDSEQEGEIYMGCAGGIDASLRLPVSYQAAESQTAFQLTVKGLKGGHSGCDIHLGRGNANKLLGRFLFAAPAELQLALAAIQGGSLRNAIPREGQAQFTIASDKVDALNAYVAEFTAIVTKELSVAEPNLTIELNGIDAPAEVMQSASQQTLVNTLHACPNGVVRMSDAIEGVVETSLNLGVVTVAEGTATILCLIRSLDDSSRNNVETTLAALAQLAGAEVSFTGAYPGWKPDNSSPVMALVRDLYQELFQREPDIMVIHAGLECGLFKKPYPEMDMVSIGPTIKFPHSPDEKVHIESVAQYWQLLTQLLKAIPAKD